MRYNNYNFLVFDLENSVLQKDGKPVGVWLSYATIKLYDINGNEKAKCNFREWEELELFLETISMRFYRYKTICYVHNLSYEFEYLIRNVSRPEKFLSNSSHSIISAVLQKFPNIEFRCTYQLSGYSLRKIGELVNLPKLESDYRNILPCEKPTQEEIDYCERDCDIVAKYIVDCLREYRMLSNIPLTKTGRVRKKLKEFYSQYKDDFIWDELPDEDCYPAMLDAFAGGIVISNPRYTGKVLKNVDGFDETSAYPFAMLKEDYPYTIKKKDKFSKADLNKKFWIAKIKFKNIISKYEWGWLSISKMNDYDFENSVYFNGKLLHSTMIIRTITNIDFESIKDTYTFDDFEILEFYELEKYNKLPSCYIKLIEVYAVRKGELKEETKHNDSLELFIDYMLAKNDFNSIYGMTVQKLENEEYYIDEDFMWKKKALNYIKTNKRIKRNFLYGIYVTAYARRNLIKGIVSNEPHLLVYGDTDSIKKLHSENSFVDTNERLEEYQDNKYIKNLGEFEHECTYDEFITFGAKKYCFRIGDKIDMRVAGVPRIDDIAKYNIHSLEDFKCGLIFKDCKLGKKYINSDFRFDLDEDFNMCNKEDMNFVNEYFDENNIKSKGGTALYSVSYLLDMTKVDKYILGSLYQWHEKRA